MDDYNTKNKYSNFIMLALSNWCDKYIKLEPYKALQKILGIFRPQFYINNISYR